MIKKLMAIINNKKIQREFFRFIICGIASTIVDFIMYGLVIYIFEPAVFNYNIISSFTADKSLITTFAVITGTAVGFLTALTVNYLISVFFVFEDSDNGKTFKGRWLFFIFSTIGFFINLVLMYLMFDILDINQWMSKIVVTAIVLVYNFNTKKLFIFNNKKDINNR